MFVHERVRFFPELANTISTTVSPDFQQVQGVEEEGGDDAPRDAGHQVAEVDGADVVEEGGGTTAVTHHGWLDLSVAKGVF